ncbi:MAG: hypothetical protein ABI432_02355 [Flavobacteriales bacterium]
MLLFDRASYWKDDLAADGFAFDKGAIRKVKVIFVYDTLSGKAQVKSVLVKEPCDNGAKDKLISLKFDRVCSFPDDSLSVLGRGSASWPLPSDQLEWVVALIYPAPGKDCVKRVYALDRLQFTKEQRDLLEIFDSLEGLSH